MSLVDIVKLKRLESIKTILEHLKVGVSKENLVRLLAVNSKSVERYINDISDLGIQVNSIGRPVHYSINYEESDNLELIEYILSNQILSAK